MGLLKLLDYDLTMTVAHFFFIVTMHSQPSKKGKGTVGVESFQGRLRLRLPRQLFDGRQKYVTLGLPDTDLNRKVAEAKAKLIESDIVLERFDYTFEKYTGQSPPKLTVVEGIRHNLTVSELWQRFYDSKRSQLKAKTREKYDNFSRLFAKVGNLMIDDALIVKEQLSKITTLDRVRDALMYLNAASRWALRHRLITTNPFDGMAQEMPKPRYMIDPQPNAFSEEEMNRVIEAFRKDSRPGITYRHYASFVEFLFRVGCRPSEAIGLTWADVSSDCSTVNFTKSLVQIGNRRVLSQGSKTNRTRAIAVSCATQALLFSIRPENFDSSALVFPGPKGDSINYRNFARRAWSAVVDPIKPHTTPYSCRDTFVTLQLLKGVPSSVIAKWCDTSTQMIDRYYADKLKLTQLRPTD